MKTRVCLLLLLAAALLAARAQAQMEPVDLRLSQDIKEHYDTFFHSQEHKDFDTLGTLLAPTYQFKKSSGETLNRADYLAQLRVARWPGNLTHEERILRAQGTKIIVKVVERYTYPDMDENHVRHIYIQAFPYQDTWDIVDGDWKKVLTEQQPVEYFQDGKPVPTVPTAR